MANIYLCLCCPHCHGSMRQLYLRNVWFLLKKDADDAKIVAGTIYCCIYFIFEDM